MTLAHGKLLILVCIITVAFASGWKVNDWRYQAQLKAQAEAINEYKDAYDVLSREIVKTHKQVEAEQVIVYREIKKEIENVTDNRICFNDASALSVWNAALIGVPQAATGTSDQTAGTDTATDKEILQNAIENFEQYTKARNQLNSLIDFYMHPEHKK